MTYEDLILISGGGGGKKFGLKNNIVKIPAKYYYSLFPNRQDAVKALKKAGFEGFGDLTISQKDGTIKVNPNATAYRKQGIKLTDYKGQHKYVMSILDPRNKFRG